MLKSQDILVLLKIVAIREKPWTYNQLAVELFMSPSEVHAAIKRAISAHLANIIQNGIHVNLSTLEEFIVHGIRYVFFPERGEITRGIPTIYTVAPLDSMPSSDELLPVWPDSMGNTRGASFSPLYRSAPKAAMKDQALYELLALVDAIRGGRSRERAMAIDEIRQRFKQ